LFTTEAKLVTWERFINKTGSEEILRALIDYLDLENTQLEDYYNHQIKIYPSMNAIQVENSNGTSICVASGSYFNGSRYDDVEISCESNWLEVVRLKLLFSVTVLDLVHELAWVQQWTPVENTEEDGNFYFGLQEIKLTTNHRLIPASAVNGIVVLKPNFESSKDKTLSIESISSWYIFKTIKESMCVVDVLNKIK